MFLFRLSVNLDDSITRMTLLHPTFLLLSLKIFTLYLNDITNKNYFFIYFFIDGFWDARNFVSFYITHFFYLNSVGIYSLKTFEIIWNLHLIWYK